MSERAKGTPNRGSLALDALCPGYGDQKRIATELGADEPQFSRWRRGVRKPDPAMRATLEEKLGIPWQAWDQDPEPAADPDDAPSSERTPTGGKGNAGNAA
jgi:transcriptional regulator with XRE-family HTH domain